MNRADDRVATEALPSFLQDAGTEADGYDADVAGEFDETLAEDDCDPDGETPDLDSAYDPKTRSARSSRARRTTTKTPGGGGGGGAMILGIICWLGAIGLGAAGERVAHMSIYGVTPTTLMIIGTVAIAAGYVRRWIAELQLRIASLDGTGGIDHSQQLAEILEQQGAGEEILGVTQQMQLSMQRQDEKTNNLTKAIKMYGKPLMDIANHGTELAATLAQVRTAVDAGSETARQAYSRIETQVRTSSGGGEQLGRLEVTMQAMAQRLEDNEVRKSLMRLEDSVGKTQAEVAQLSSGESVDSAAKTIQDELRSATSKLHAGLQELRDGNLGELETTVRGIQRDVATVATAVSQIQAALKSGAMGAPARAAASAPAATSAPAPSAQAPSSPAPAPTSADGGPAGGDGPDTGGYKTGARRTGSKNVLGAIAKLKQMKN